VTRKPARRKAGQNAGRSIEIRKIHIGASALKLIQPGDDSSYRDMLFSVARVRSSKDLDAAGRDRVLAYLRAAGWKDTSPPAPNRNGVRAGKPQVKKLRALWAALGAAGELREPEESGLRSYVRKQSQPYHPDGVGYDAPELLPPKVAQRVIEHLKQWCRRAGVELK